MSAGWRRDKWDDVVRGLTSSEDEDAHDTLNVMSVQKNAHKVADLLHATMPGLDPSLARAPPKGMNRADSIRDGLSESMRAWYQHSHGAPASVASADARVATARPTPPVARGAQPQVPPASIAPSAASQGPSGETGVLV